MICCDTHLDKRKIIKLILLNSHLTKLNNGDVWKKERFQTPHTTGSVKKNRNKIKT